MPFFTENQLRGFADAPLVAANEREFIKESAEQAQVTIFLSHSHKDAKEVKGLIRHFAQLGIKIYVDWNDSNMPRETNRQTADLIKARIAQFSIFIVLATPNALASRWVPWEVGIADKTKGERKVLIVPVADPSGRFDGNEYLQLYRRVVIADDGRTAVFEPNQTSGAYFENYLRDWGV